MVRWQIFENRWPTPPRGRRSEWNVGYVEGPQSRSAAEAPVRVKFGQCADEGVLAGKKVGKKIDRLAAQLRAHNVHRCQKAAFFGAGEGWNASFPWSDWGQQPIRRRNRIAAAKDNKRHFTADGQPKRWSEISDDETGHHILENSVPIGHFGRQSLLVIQSEFCTEICKRVDVDFAELGVNYPPSNSFQHARLVAKSSPNDLLAKRAIRQTKHPVMVTL